MGELHVLVDAWRYWLHGVLAGVSIKNIGFGKPSQDDCDVCAKYMTHCENLDGAYDVDACEQCKVGQDY